jgi:hypothetical protein
MNILALFCFVGGIFFAANVYYAVKRKNVLSGLVALALLSLAIVSIFSVKP